MTEFTEEEQSLILEMIYEISQDENIRETIAGRMDTSDEIILPILNKVLELLNKQAKQNPN